MQEAKVSECGPAFVCTDELHRELDKRDLRLSAVETSLMCIQTWSTIMTNELADVSAQVKVASVDFETWDDSKISKRFSEVEQKVEALQINALEAPELVARIEKAEQKMQEMLANIQRVLVKFLPDVQDRNEGTSKCLDLRGAEQKSTVHDLQSTVHDLPPSPKSTITASFRSTPQLPTSTQSQFRLTRMKSLTPRGCFSARSRHRDGDEPKAAINPTTVMNPNASRPQTRVADGLPRKLMKRSSTSALHDVNPQVAALVGPRGQPGIIRDSCSRQSLLAQRPCTVAPSRLDPAFRKGHSMPALPQSCDGCDHLTTVDQRPCDYSTTVDQRPCPAWSQVA